MPVPDSAAAWPLLPAAPNVPEPDSVAVPLCVTPDPAAFRPRVNAVIRLFVADAAVNCPPPIDAPALPAEPFPSQITAEMSAELHWFCLLVLPDGIVGALPPSAAPPPR